MVAITYRTLGPWGIGKGANLQPSEVDSNFWAVAEAIVALQTNPAQPNGIASITVSGTQMTIALDDGSELGPYTLPVLTFRWRGEWDAGASYAVLDVVSVFNTGIFMAEVAHTAPPVFDGEQEIDGEPVWLQLFGSVDATLSGLSDVEITSLADTDFLRWDDGAGQWVNIHLGTIAYQEADAVAITGGRITGMPTPTVPGEVATKGYVDALPLGATAAPGTMLSNITAGPAPSIPNTLSNYLDYVLAATATGTFLYRSASGWEAFDPGVPGTFLQTHGAGSDPTWEVGASGVTMVMPGTGITTGATAITATGTVGLAAIPDRNILANASGSSAAPTPHTLSEFLDVVLSNARGSILTRTTGGWVSLAPGLVGQFLQTQGSGADLRWDSPSGAGTVTSVNAGTGISTGGSPITGAGAVSLAATANQTLLANISGGSAAPAPALLSTILDAVLGTARGSLLVRTASVWTSLAPGTGGQVLTTGGAGADAAWANAAAAAPIANLLMLANISGSTATATGQSVSAVLDAVFSSARGSLLFRGASGWQALAPGTSGDVLTTAGSGANPIWTTPAATAPSTPGGSSGQVQYNNAGAFAGFTLGGDATLNTGTGALSLATVNSNVGTFNSVTVNGKGLVTAATVSTRTEFFTVAVSDETTAITTGVAKTTFRMPFALTLSEMRASLSTASSSGIPTIDVNEGGVSIFSTRLTIDAGEKTSTTAAAAAVISDTALADDAEITIDIDVAGTGARGLKVTFLGTR